MSSIITQSSKSIFFIIGIWLLSSCSASKSSGWFSSTNNEAGWTEVLIASHIKYDLAWDDVSAIIIRRFEPEMINKETGYIRTKWKYNWNSDGKETKNYRVRVTIKMSEQRKKVQINAEAQSLHKKTWMTGYDTELLSVMKQDITGVIGS